MAKWNSQVYLQFERERTQPAIDLIQRIRMEQVENSIDIGCGPGNSTGMLSEFFPNSSIMGIDQSEEMIKRAKEEYSGLHFEQCNIETELHTITKKYDLVFSNACLQWVPNHEDIIPKLLGLLNDNGMLAVQIPYNQSSALYEAVDSVVANQKWNFKADELERNEILLPEQYFDLLSRHADDFSIWEQVYYHKMANHEQMIEWIKATKLRPYLNALSSDREKESLMSEILEEARVAYPQQQNGQIIFRFKRLFFTARKK